MNLLFRDMPLFTEVARCKSYTVAADKLDMYASTLSRRIAALEKAMGVPLFMRNTRRVELTTAGSMLLDRAEFILQETQNAWNAVVENMTQPMGLVRVSMFEYAYHNLMYGVFSRFAEEWPDIQLHVHFNDRPVDLLTEPYDVDFQPGPLRNSDCKARKILTIEPRLYASPRFLEKYPAPQSPDDLAALPCICLSRLNNVWPLFRKGARKDVALRPAFVFSSISLCREFALAGHGIAMIRRHLAQEDVRAGRLVSLLPEWSGETHNMYLVTAPGQTPKRIQVFVDYLARYYASVRRSQ